MSSERWALKEPSTEAEPTVRASGMDSGGIHKDWLDRVRVLDEGEVAVPVAEIRRWLEDETTWSDDIEVALHALLPTPPKAPTADEIVEEIRIIIACSDEWQAISIRPLRAILEAYDAAKGDSC